MTKLLWWRFLNIILKEHQGVHMINCQSKVSTNKKHKHPTTPPIYPLVLAPIIKKLKVTNSRLLSIILPFFLSMLLRFFKFNKFTLGGSGGDVKNSKAYCGVKREPTMFATSFHNTHVYFKTDSHITHRFDFLQILL